MLTMETDYKRKWFLTPEARMWLFLKEKEDMGQEDHLGRFGEGASYSLDGVYHYLMDYAQLNSWIYLHL